MSFEQIKRQARRIREQIEEPTEAVAVDTADLDESVACCLADIDEVLAEVPPRAEWTDSQVIDAGDPNWDDAEWQMRWDQVGYKQARNEFIDARVAYDAAYERLTGVSNRRDCGCGCR